MTCLAPENGESSGNDGGGSYSFLRIILHVGGDGKIYSVVLVHPPWYNMELCDGVNSFSNSVWRREREGVRLRENEICSNPLCAR